jgi:integrase
VGGRQLVAERRFRRFVWKHSASTASASSLSAPRDGRIWTITAWSFPSQRGTPIEPENLRRSWGEIRQGARLGATRFHDLRRTCVTLLLDLGTPPHVVREIVGHSAIEVTVTIYAHVSLDEKRKAPRKLGEALG